MILRRINIILAFLFIAVSSFGQVVTRSEIAPYAMRQDAVARKYSESDEATHIKFAPAAVTSDGSAIVREQLLEVPQSWVDAVVMIHIESAGSAYTLYVNGMEVAACEDSLTPTDYDITRYLRFGANVISTISRPSQLEHLEHGVERPDILSFEGSYIYIQSRLRILDYELEMTEHTNGDHGQLFINVIVENRFNYTETISVGFDVYDPAGKLLDFSTSEATLEGNSTDTIRFSPHLYGAKKHRWSPAKGMAMRRVGQPSGRTTNQGLYSVMLFTRRNGTANNYIPFSVGFSLPEYDGKELKAWDIPITLKVASYNVGGDKKASESDLRKLKSSGYNTIKPDYPQPLWFYSLCDKTGLYVIDQAAINAPNATEDRAVGGTASNNPAMLDQYLERVQKMYYRTRNFTCVVAYSLGGDSGNGYNMYKAYQWLKSVEPRRPILYKGAAGEWNSDELNIEW